MTFELQGVVQFKCVALLANPNLTHLNNHAVSSPFQIVVMVSLLLWLLGPPALLGVSVLLLCFLAQTKILRMAETFRKQIVSSTDSRLKLLTELFSNIRVRDVNKIYNHSKNQCESVAML